MRKIGILGTGVVGQTIGAKLIALGYEVKMGSRTAGNEKATAWADKNGDRASQGSFEEAVKYGDLVFNCTKGLAAPDVVRLAGVSHFRGKTLIDVSNPLDTSNGMPPSLLAAYCNTHSLAEGLQQLIPDAHVVKTLNIVNCEVMVNAQRSGGDPTMFLCGNHAGAKTEAKNILGQFGWTDIIDLGDITNARGMEMLLPLWVRTWMATGNGHFAFKVVR